jgi:hypothetical protein
MGIGPLPEPLQEVRSLGPNETGCAFVRSLYIEVRDQTMNYYVARNTVKFGGNRYRITNTSHEFVMGVNILMVNFEIYKCEDVGEDTGDDADIDLYKKRVPNENN